jgi:uncharacterized membrane protein YkvA (DUF1232 family)
MPAGCVHRGMDALRSRGFASKLYRYLKDPAVSSLRKGVGLVAVVYLLLPLDAVPDVIPLIGWLDDVGVLSAAGLFLSREVRRHATLEA